MAILATWPLSSHVGSTDIFGYIDTAYSDSFGESHVTKNCHFKQIYARSDTCPKGVTVTKDVCTFNLISPLALVRLVRGPVPLRAVRLRQPHRRQHLRRQGRGVPRHHRDRHEHGRGRRPGSMFGGERRGRLQGLFQFLRRAGKFVMMLMLPELTHQVGN